MFSRPSVDLGLQGQRSGWRRELRRDCVLPKRGHSGKKTCSTLRMMKTIFIFMLVNRLSFLMAAMLGKEEVMLGLMNAMVWGRVVGAVS